MANVVGTLIFEMSSNIARLQADMAKAQAVVGGAMDSIKSAAGVAKTALEGIGVALSVHAFASIVEGAIEATNALHELSLKTGQTVETLSSLRIVARESSTEMDSVAKGLQLLSKNMVQAHEGTGKAAGMFQSLGISVVDANGRLRDSGAVMQEIGGKLSSMENRTQAVAAAQILMGKAGANLIPFMEELANAHDLVATRTTEQAERAHDLVVAMAKMSGRTQLLKEDFAMGMTPALLQASQAFVELSQRSDNAASLGETLGTAIRYVALVAGSAWLAMKDMGDAIGALGAQGATLLQGNLKAVREIGRERDAQAAANQKQFEEFQKRILAPTPQIEHAAKSRAGQFDLPEKEAKTRADHQMSFEELMAKASMKRIEQQDADEKSFTKAYMAEVEKRKKASEQEAEAAARAFERDTAYWKDLIDPSQKYFDQLKRIDELIEKGALDAEQGEKARAIAMARASDALGGTADALKSNDDFAKKFGLTMTSAFEKAVIDGNSLRDVLKGLDKDIAQIILRQTVTTPLGNAVSGAIKDSSFGSSISNFLSGIFGGSSSGTDASSGSSALGLKARAGGGPVSAGDAYLVGENGPELIVPGSSGTVIPNDQLGGGQTVVVNFNVNANDVRSFAQSAYQIKGLLVGWVREAFNQRGAVTPVG